MDITARLAELRAKKAAGASLTVNHLILEFLQGIEIELRHKLPRFGPYAFIEDSGIDNVGPHLTLRAPPPVGNPHGHGDFVSLHWKSDRNLFAARYVSISNATAFDVLKLPLGEVGQMTNHRSRI